MPFKIEEETIEVKCRHIRVVRDGQALEDIFTCSVDGDGFLYARNGAVEYFEIPTKTQAPPPPPEWAGEETGE